MGNAHAASWGWGSSTSTPKELVDTAQPPSPVPPPAASPAAAAATVPVIPKVPVPETSSKSESGKATGMGTYEELHRPCKEIALIPFEGVRFMVNKGLSSHFQVQHTVSLNNEKSTYKFASTFVGSKQYSPTEAFPVMTGEMSNEGDLQAQFIHQFTEGLKLKCIAQTAQSKLQSVQIGTDILLKDSSLSLVTVDPNLFNRTGMLIVHYLQAVTPKLAIGSELLYQRGPARQQAIVTFAGKYYTKNWQLATTFGVGGLHASFYRKANENVQVGVELEASLRTLESVTSLVYQFDLPKMNLVFKGMLNSDWTIASFLEKKLMPLPITLQLTGTYNIKKDKVSCGIGAVLG